MSDEGIYEQNPSRHHGPHTPRFLRLAPEIQEPGGLCHHERTERSFRIYNNR